VPHAHLPLVALLASACAASHPAPTPGTPSDASHSTSRSHDFDFSLGTWHTHVRRLQNPLRPPSTPPAWVDYDGTTTVRRVWQGRANLVELDVTGPAGHIEGLSLRLYDPVARTWSLHFASSHDGALGPPTVGTFANGRGEFVGHETIGGRDLLVRFVISAITPTSCHFEQAFSADDGATWEVNWIADDTRLSAAAD
jgi:hypothetical protein